MRKMILAPVEVEVNGVHCNEDCEFFAMGECCAFGTARSSKKLKRNRLIDMYFRCQGCISGQLLMEKRIQRAKEKKSGQK